MSIKHVSTVLFSLNYLQLSSDYLPTKLPFSYPGTTQSRPSSRSSAPSFLPLSTKRHTRSFACGVMRGPRSDFGSLPVASKNSAISHVHVQNLISYTQLEFERLTRSDSQFLGALNQLWNPLLRLTHPQRRRQSHAALASRSECSSTQLQSSDCNIKLVNFIRKCESVKELRRSEWPLCWRQA